jgi:putative membrane protein
MNTFAHGGFWPVIPLVWGLFWVAVVAFALWVRRQRGQGTPSRTEATPTASAERILAERYARGEMNDDEYFEKMSVLKGAAS